MSLAEQLSSAVYLNERHVRFEVERHAEASTAGSEALALGLSRDVVLKPVVLRVAGDDLVLAVIPASKKLDMNLLREALGDAHVRLATEAEIKDRFPDYDLGALPPLPGLLGIRAFVDPSVFDQNQIAFADGRQTESFLADPRMLFWGEEVFVTPLAWEPDTWASWDSEGGRFAVE